MLNLKASYTAKQATTELKNIDTGTSKQLDYLLDNSLVSIRLVYHIDGLIINKTRNVMINYYKNTRNFYRNSNGIMMR